MGILLMTDHECAAYSRDPDDILQSDWQSVVCTLKMICDRVYAGQKVRIPLRDAAHWMTVELYRHGVMRLIDDALSTAEIVRAE